MSRVPPQPTGGKDLPRAEELEHLEELGDDAIIAQQRGAHSPQPRAQVTEEARSIVISDNPPRAEGPKRRERTEKTVVIRDRRQIDDLRREMAKRKPKPPPAMPGIWIWVVVGVAAFLSGGLVALLATRDEAPATAPIPSLAVPQPVPPASSNIGSEPPSVSIDELPVEGSKPPK